MKLELMHEDEKLLTRRIKVKVNGKEFETPIKVFELLSSKDSSPFDLLKNFTKENKGLIEFRLNITQDNLIKMDNDINLTSRFIYKIRKKLEDVDNNVILLIPIYKIKNQNISKDEIEYLSDFLLNLLRNNIIDILSIPIIKYGSKDIDLDFYLNNFVKPFLEHIFSYNKERISEYFLGYIPKISHRRITQVIDIYLKYNITNFVVEFNYSNPISYGPTLEKLITTVLLMEKEIEREGTIIHGINVNKGLAKKSEEIVSAIDILSFCQGITSFSFPFRRIPFKLIKSQINLSDEQTFRIFEPYDYGYHRYSKDDIGKLADDEKIEKVENIKDIERAINTKRIYIESSIIREKITENNVLKYLKSKNEIKDYLERLEKSTNNVKKDI
ncbi:MAG: hypothetical protein ACO2ON_03360 [Candidatus Nanopusillus sp.]